MITLTPFLLFEGTCAEAMTFYQACLGGELTLIRLGDTPMAAGFPERDHHKITYACIKGGRIEFSATDWLHPVQEPRPGNMAAMYVTGDEPGELRAVFNKLAAGAKQEFFVELREMPFGLYGHFTDRYGVSWFFRGAKPTGLGS